MLKGAWFNALWMTLMMMFWVGYRNITGDTSFPPTMKVLNLFTLCIGLLLIITLWAIKRVEVDLKKRIEVLEGQVQVNRPDEGAKRPSP